MAGQEKDEDTHTHTMVERQLRQELIGGVLYNTPQIILTSTFSKNSNKNHSKISKFKNSDH
jgi:hypothetical protein